MNNTTLNQIHPIKLDNVTIQDAFWTKWQRLIKESIIPYQWRALNDQIPGAEPSRTITNFEIAAGRVEGKHYGMVFQDSDLYKWMETVAFSLQLERDPEWESIMDQVVELIGEAQEEDGYLNTYFTVNHPDKKWTNLKDDHELYCIGHLIEAAVAYYQATGKDQIIAIVNRAVDHIAEVIGNGEGQIAGYPGHPEIELALMKLYRVTNDDKHLQLCRFFIEERGKRNPQHFFDEECKARGVETGKDYTYYQAHKPIHEQTTAEGHAVRAVYLYSGMADLATELQDQDLLDISRTLWENTVNKRMYITGGIGSSSFEERFTVDYDLPNDRAYTETCASVAMIMWAQRMVQIEADADYTDVLERVLYNGALSGIALDGQSYFYVNPLEVWPHTANYRQDMDTIMPVRQPWFGCACCPPNIARLLASLGQYVYSANEEELYVHLYISGETECVMNGSTTKVMQQSNYPWDGNIDVEIATEQPNSFTLALRLPGWCRNYDLRVNGESIAAPMEKGYLIINRVWNQGDQITLALDMPVEVVRSHPNVRANAGKIALQRGPIVYCLEEKDNGANLQDLQVDSNQIFKIKKEDELLGGVVVVEGIGKQTDQREIPSTLYSTVKAPLVEKEIRAIPYYAWSNRGENEMTVWIREA
ncbi:glycoside hydrolase family 127 protein [Gracilibacillus phocaeensis]|uniref:glycoside hydrolase family 127 protein n=1 Tax=Gracilibacillus phocaeensis TaxID=2042304 RepID=UPI001030A6F9|nr:beta-L-arabinofuranosidase domain-containing protein [Gracilibacillus phocaeensis]